MNDLQPSNILIYRADDDRFRLEVKLEDQTIWLSQKQIGELYQKDKTTISEPRQLFGNSEQLSRLRLLEWLSGPSLFSH